MAVKRTYEAIVIVSPELNEEQSGKVLSQLGDVVSRNEGRVMDTLPLGKRRLAYPIGKASEGLYYQVKIELPSLQVGTVEKAAKMLDGCVRIMITHESGLPSQPQAGDGPTPRREEVASTDQKAAEVR
jgi:small subunit ribosomal protein S6